MGDMKSLSVGYKSSIVGWCGGNYTTQAYTEESYLTIWPWPGPLRLISFGCIHYLLQSSVLMQQPAAWLVDGVVGTTIHNSLFSPVVHLQASRTSLRLGASLQPKTAGARQRARLLSIHRFQPGGNRCGTKGRSQPHL